MPHPTRVIANPRNMEKCLLVAFFLCRGMTKADAAKMAKVDPSSVHRWKAQPWWPDVMAKARERWLSDVTDKARGVIEDSMDDPGERAQMARFVAERTIPELAPPAIMQQNTLIMADRVDLGEIRSRLTERMGNGVDHGAGTIDAPPLDATAEESPELEARGDPKQLQ